MIALVLALAAAIAAQDLPGWRDTPSGTLLEADGRPVIELSCASGRLGVKSSALPPIEADRDVAVLVDGKPERAAGIADRQFTAAFTPPPGWFETLGKAERLTLALSTLSRDFPSPGPETAQRLASLCALPSGRPALWRVRSPNGVEATLFGAVHALPEGTAWRSPALDAAISRVQVVAFEIDDPPEAQTASLNQVLAEGVTAKSRLSTKLSAQGQARLKTAAAKLGLDFDRLDQAEPWLAEIILSRALISDAKIPTGVGVEGQIVAALPPGTRMVGLERPGESAAQLRGAPEATQLAVLEQRLAGAGRDVRADYDRSLVLWLAGDVNGMEAMVAEMSEGKRNLMLWARNRLWLARISTLLSGRENVLIVVGAAHMLGPDGLPSILRAQGYTVDGP
jgi:uncharacterized protein YbaP (TraB family)